MISARPLLQEPIHQLSVDTTYNISTHPVPQGMFYPNSFWSHTILGELVFFREVSSQPWWCTSDVTALVEETVGPEEVQG